MKKAERTIQIILLLIIIAYSQFYKLNVLAYRIWDEARLATSAYEMTKTGNLLIPTIGNSPDMWSTKPPLMIWAEAVCIKLHGLTEFSTRFPSALSSSLTILIVFIFILSVTRNGWLALLSGIILCTAQGYIGYHGTRYGEYDSMLTLFTTCYLISFFLYTNSEGERKNKYLLLFFIALTLAVLTKGIAAMLILPALLLYVIVRKKLLATLQNKYFYWGLLLFILVAPGYYFLREHYNPGYLQAVFENELGGRFLNTTEAHSGPPGYYLAWLRFDGFGNWFWALPTSLVLFLFNKNKQYLNVSFYFILCSITFLLVISISKTKLPWYTLPVYPLLSIIIAMLMLQLSEIVNLIFNTQKPNVSLLIIISLFSAQPVYEAFQMIRCSSPETDDPSYNISYYLRNAAHNHQDLNGYTFISDGYDIQWQLYIHRLNDLGITIDSKYPGDENKYTAGKKLIAQESKAKNLIETRYNVDVLEEYKNIRLYKITGQKIR